MKQWVDYKKRLLQFRFDAGTSRGVLRSKETFFVVIRNSAGTEGIGEAGPLKGLSIDDIPEFELQVATHCQLIADAVWPQGPEEVTAFVYKHIPEHYPSLRFAFETAFYDLLQGGKRMIFDTPFYHHQRMIPINGLIWMGSADFMREQIDEKLANGFKCIKMKIGAIDFEEEIKLLQLMRKSYTSDELTLRVDANGAFLPQEAISKLKRLSELDIHSIEQPIRPGQGDAMRRLCELSPLPIALDEELIGVGSSGKSALLRSIRPPYIIIKPSLVGGIAASRDWIAHAQELNIGWWITSALESNIGLNAVSQLADSYNVSIPQGLGTGQLYQNNIASPLEVYNGFIHYRADKDWGVI